LLPLTFLLTKITRQIILKRLEFWEKCKGQFARKQEVVWLKQLKRWDRIHG